MANKSPSPGRPMPGPAKKTGAAQKVAREFSKADKGGKLISKAMKRGK